jgi:predicted transposase/invertase (TIGR01784 family)
MLIIRIRRTKMKSIIHENEKNLNKNEKNTETVNTVGVQEIIPVAGSQPILKPKLDVVFKMIFADPEGEGCLKSLISSIIGIPKEEITELTIENTELIPELVEDKFSRLDIKARVNGRKINIEIQVAYDKDYISRTIFYWAKLFTEGFKKGTSYSKLSGTISINILGFDWFECEEYWSHYQLIEKDRGDLLTDKVSFHYLELKKAAKEHGDSTLLQWLHLINAETEDDLMAAEALAQKTNVPEIQDAIVRIRTLSADERARELAYQRELALHERATWEENLREAEEKTRKAEEKTKKAEERAEKAEKKSAALIEVLKAEGYTEERIAEILGK